MIEKRSQELAKSGKLRIGEGIYPGRTNRYGRKA
jgi:hypothetical protein